MTFSHITDIMLFMTENETYWAAGTLEMIGSFFIVPTTGTTTHAVRYVARSSQHRDALLRLASLLGVNTTTVNQKGSVATQVVLQGSTLHRVMTTLWPALTHSRKLEYANARKELKRLLGE